MKKHADLIRPKFEALISIMEEDLGGLDIAEWTNPKGGYFIGFDSMPGCAKEIVAKMKEAGVILTGAGATSHIISIRRIETFVWHRPSRPLMS